MPPQSLPAVCKALFLTGCLAACAVAQTPAAPANPANSAVPPMPTYVSPEVHADGSATLRLAAPNAQKVEANVEGTVLPMERDASGMWTGTTAVLAPEIYSYRFRVDGQWMLDPRNTDARHNLLALTDDLTIPGTPPEPWEIQAIPHGIVEHHVYTSQVVLGLPNHQSNYYVYLPPGYNAKARAKYPVLYLLHGYSDAADGWSSVGKANYILDSLIASGKARPMLVVMTLGYGNMQVITGPRSPKLNQQNYDLFEKALVTEVIPQIEADYHVSKKREDRAIAGLSMGGHESLFTGLKHPELFASIGAFSAGLNAKQVAELPPTNPQKADLKLLWIACGVDDGLFKPNQDAIAALKAEGLPVTAIQTPGHHQWSVWRDNLIHFAPLLFQPTH